MLLLDAEYREKRGRRGGEGEAYVLNAIHHMLLAREIRIKTNLHGFMLLGWILMVDDDSARSH